MTTLPAYCDKCLLWMSQHIDGKCPDPMDTADQEQEARDHTFDVEDR